MSFLIERTKCEARREYDSGISSQSEEYFHEKTFEEEKVNENLREITE